LFIFSFFLLLLSDKKWLHRTLTNTRAYSSMNGYPMPSDQGLFFPFTEPSREQYSGSWNQLGGPQYFQVQTQSSVAKGFRNPQRTRIGQDGASDIDDNYFNASTRQWQGLPQTSMETTGSSHIHDESTGSDHDKMDSVSLISNGSGMSYTISSGQSDILGCSPNISESGLYTHTNYVDNHEAYSELQFQDEEETTPGHSPLPQGLSNAVSRRPSHLIPVSHGSPLSIFSTSAEDIFTSGAEMAQSMVTAGIYSKNSAADAMRNFQMGLMPNQWSPSGAQAPSPPFTGVDNLSLGPSMLSPSDTALDHLVAFNGQSPR
jgi:hypothetical protein